MGLLYFKKHLKLLYMKADVFPKIMRMCQICKNLNPVYNMPS